MPHNHAVILRQMALIALVIGTSRVAAATERVDLSLVLAGFVSASAVPLVQLLTGLLLLRGAGGARARALESYFAQHWPWSLWILAVHGAFLIVPALRDNGAWTLPTVILPVALTVRLLLRVCRRDLDLPRRTAQWRVLQHQALTFALLLAYLSWASALWPRIVGLS